MTLQRHLGPWSGTLYRHVAAGSPRSILDDAYIGIATDNRWNLAGMPTYYFATDVAILVAEFARHIARDLPEGEMERLERSLWKVPARMQSVLRLTDPAVVAAMGAGPIEHWILDVDTTQAAAAYLRSQLPGLQALIVQSAAFLDDHERFNVVVYRDRIDPRTAFGRPRFVRSLVLEAIGSG